MKTKIVHINKVWFKFNIMELAYYFPIGMITCLFTTIYILTNNIKIVTVLEGLGIVFLNLILPVIILLFLKYITSDEYELTEE